MSANAYVIGADILGMMNDPTRGGPTKAPGGGGTTTPRPTSSPPPAPPPRPPVQQLPRQQGGKIILPTNPTTGAPTPPKPPDPKKMYDAGDIPKGSGPGGTITAKDINKNASKIAQKAKDDLAKKALKQKAASIAQKAIAMGNRATKVRLKKTGGRLVTMGNKVKQKADNIQGLPMVIGDSGPFGAYSTVVSNLMIAFMEGADAAAQVWNGLLDKVDTLTALYDQVKAANLMQLADEYDLIIQRVDDVGAQIDTDNPRPSVVAVQNQLPPLSAQLDNWASRAQIALATPYVDPNAVYTDPGYGGAGGGSSDPGTMPGEEMPEGMDDFYPEEQPFGYGGEGYDGGVDWGDGSFSDFQGQPLEEGFAPYGDDFSDNFGGDEAQYDEFGNPIETGNKQISDDGEVFYAAEDVMGDNAYLVGADVLGADYVGELFGDSKFETAASGSTTRADYQERLRNYFMGEAARRAGSVVTEEDIQRYLKSFGDSYWKSSYVLGVDTIPKAVSYTDQSTVLATQKALKQKGYDPGPLDGIFGPKTSAAIKKMQKDAGLGQSGIVDYGVLSALKVNAPASTPTTTTAGRSASAAAKDADAVAAMASTPAQVQAASQQVEAANAVAMPPPPPEVQTKVAQASAAAKAARTPAEVQSAALQVQDAAKAVVSATSFWGSPVWTGAPVKRWQAAAGIGATVSVALGLALVARR